MAFPSPLQEALESYQISLPEVGDGAERSGAAEGNQQEALLAEFLPWGETGCIVLATAGIVELEYASIQKGSCVFDACCRGAIEITGEDRIEFMNRISTQQFENLNVGDSTLAFVANRKGKIVGDVIVHIQEHRLMLDIDIHAVDDLLSHFDEYIVMEDVTVKDCTQSTHWLWCLGPDSVEMSVSFGQKMTLPHSFLGLQGTSILLDIDNIAPCWKSLIEDGVRPVGWYALNMSRVEQGAAMFLIDFDQSNLPHETNLISSRVRFDKGCYLGQEIVARMESLGKPKQKLVQLHIEDDEALPIAGAQLWIDESCNGTPIGVVTSSTLSPLRSGKSAVIAMVSKKCFADDTELYVYIGSEVYKVAVKPLTDAPSKVSHE